MSTLTSTLSIKNNELWYNNIMTDLQQPDNLSENGKQAHEEHAYYSEKALNDAFLAGQLLAKADNAKMRAAIISELRAELHAAVDNMELWYNIIMTDLQEKLDAAKAARDAARDAWAARDAAYDAAYDAARVVAAHVAYDAADAADDAADDTWAVALAASAAAYDAYDAAVAAYAEAVKTYLKWTLIQS